ncbi:MAG: REP-associated tyrosine transposase [Phycisphaerales bacterium]
MPDTPPIRKRMRRWEIPTDLRFATFSCQHRLPLLKNQRICAALLASIASARSRLGLRVFAWVFMPEHVHLVCRPAEGATLERALRSIKMSIAKRAIERWKAFDAPILRRVADEVGRPRFWQKGGGFDRNVRDMDEFAREVRYVHRNPVERGLVSRPEDWCWSSVRWWMGTRGQEFECDAPPGRPGTWDLWTGYK